PPTFFAGCPGSGTPPPCAGATPDGTGSEYRTRGTRSLRAGGLRLVALLLLTLGITAPALGAPDGPKPNARLEATIDEPEAEARAPSTAGLPWLPTPDDFKGLRSVALIGLVSLAPAALLMFT